MKQTNGSYYVKTKLQVPHHARNEQPFYWKAYLFRIFDRCLTATICCLTKTEWYISILDHMFDLTLHSNDEENDEIQKEDGPEYRHVEYTKEGHANGGKHGPCARVPELELREPSCKWSGCVDEVK